MRYHVIHWHGYHQKANNSVDKDVEKWELSYTAGEDVKWSYLFEKPRAGSQKVKHTVTI